VENSLSSSYNYFDMKNAVFLGLIASIVLFGLLGYHYSWWWYIVLAIFILLLGVAISDYMQTKHALKRNFPVLGHMRYIAEWMRPKLFQYFVEPDHDGRPFSRLDRSLIYQRAKKDVATTPFGTQLNVYETGYEWMSHSIAALDHHHIVEHPRTKVGGKLCIQPYDLSVFNVSAMSYGSLSSAAVEALNGGAAKGGFAHNTGEGGISPSHNKNGGDLIYQIGTGYFGSRTKEGQFSDELFAQKAKADNVKMIEIKLSQGAKPGHGGILPGKKVTPEIAAIRNVEIGKDVLSPPYHTAFTTPIGLIEFIGKLQKLSGGKPVGFKLCVGQKHEFIAICKAMVETGIKPDFITVDGGEGGTGAAPLEFSNYVGMPLRDGLAFVYDTLVGFNVKRDITIIAAGKVSSGFGVIRNIALGADACYSARAMMMAVGCIQALECNKNTCPTGVATQDPALIRGLDIPDKTQRVYQYHKETIASVRELLAASGLTSLDQINRRHINRRLGANLAKRYDELYPYIAESCLLKRESVPETWLAEWTMARTDSFAPKFMDVYVAED
jgi:glutamate synthase domain-containing protein 2